MPDQVLTYTHVRRGLIRVRIAHNNNYNHSLETAKQLTRELGVIIGRTLSLVTSDEYKIEILNGSMRGVMCIETGVIYTIPDTEAIAMIERSGFKKDFAPVLK